MKQNFELSLKQHYKRNYILSIIIPIFLILALNLVLIVYSFRTVFLNSNDKILTSIKNYINESLIPIESISYSPYLNKELFQTLIYYSNGYYNGIESGVTDLLLSYYMSHYVSYYTKSLHTVSDNLVSINFYPVGQQEGKCYSITKNYYGIKVFNTDLKYIEILNNDTNNKRQLTVVSNKSNESDKTYLSLIKRIRDVDSKRDIGFLEINFTKDKIEQFLFDNCSYNSEYYIFRGENRIVSSHNSKMQIEKVDDLSRDNSKYYVQSKELTDLGLIIVSRTPKVILLSKVLGMCLIATVFILISYVIAYRYYIQQSNETINSVNSILDTLSNFKKGKFDYKCQVNDAKEYRVMADEINNTGAKIKALINNVTTSKIEASNANYLALQRQISPHFLSNTLNSFIGLNRCGEKDLLDESIITLAKLFKYISRSDGTSTIKEEMEFCKEYLDLQKIKYEDNLTYNIDCSKDTGEFVIPRLILQPIIENSIMHGIGETNMISIDIKSYMKVIDNVNYSIIAVRDDGVGFDMSNFNLSASVGLGNVKQRLLHFNSESKIVFNSQIGSGTMIEIYLKEQRKI